MLVARHPNMPEPYPVYYVTSPLEARNLRPELRTLVDDRTLDFFLDYPNSLSALSKLSPAKGFQDWLTWLSTRSCALTIVSECLRSFGGASGGSLLTFPDLSDRPAWELAPYDCPAIELGDRRETWASVGFGLEELVGSMQIRFSGWHGSDYLGGAGRRVLDVNYENPSEQEHYWKEFEDEAHIPLSELVPFYASSGTYLLVDRSGSVWCGGVVGPIWKSDLTLDETIERIFSRWAAGGYPGVHEMCDPPMPPGF